MLGIRAGHLLQRSVLACGRAATQRALRAAPPVLSLHASATSPNAPASSELSSSLSGTSMQKRAMVKIGTHSGTFHLDEALGCYMLRLTDTYKDAEIVRSRDPAVLKVRRHAGPQSTPSDTPDHPRPRTARCPCYLAC